MKTTLSDQISASPLLWVSTALVTGIVLASLKTLEPLAWFGLAFAGLVVALLVHRLRPQASFAILLIPGFIFIGAARYQMAQPIITPESISYYNDLDRRVYVTGTLAEPPDVRDTYMNLRINTSAIDLGLGDIPVHGAILIRLTNEYDLVYGNLVRVRGFVQTPPTNEEFSYRDYLANQGINSTIQTSTITILPGSSTEPFWGWIYQVKDSLNKSLYRLFPDPEASLLAGILLGMAKAIPASVQQSFQNTGTAHIIAISGFNIAILATIVVSIFSRLFGKRMGALLAIAVIIFYTLLVGASASVVRAAIMGTLTVIAGQFGRRSLALTTLAVSAMVMALLNPLVLWDVGFQLSFAATLGLVLYGQALEDAFTSFLGRYFSPKSVDRFVAPFSEYFLLTFVAQLTTLPVIIYHFGRLSLVSFIANPAVLPAQPAVMILSGLALLFSRLYLPLGQAFAWAAWPFAAYTVRMVEFFNGFPGGVVTLGEFSLLAAVVFYIVLFGLTLAWSRVKGILTPGAIFSLLAIFTVLTWSSVFNAPDGRLHVIFLDTGSSDGMLLITPSGRFVLINGGDSPSALADQLGRRIPAFSRGIDTLIVASTQENQVAALPRVLEQYHPKMVLWSGNPQASFSSQRLIDSLTTNQVALQKVKKDAAFDLGDGVILRILAVSARGAVLSIEMGKFKAILPIGVNYDVFAALKNGSGLGPVTALSISESGYGPSNPPEWLANLNPQVAILSVAAGDPNGMPSPDVLKAFENKNLMRTDVYGWIDLSSDGQAFWITNEKK